jgi:hypothetical protein
LHWIITLHVIAFILRVAAVAQPEVPTLFEYGLKLEEITGAEVPAAAVSAVGTTPSPNPAGSLLQKDYLSSMPISRMLPEPVVAVRALPPERFHLKTALLQSFEFLMLQHAFRVADDPSLRYSLAHSPFFHNWFASYKGYDLKRWGDGDSFLVNDVGHPLQGAVASRIYLQNSPAARSVPIGKNSRYWTSRLKGMAWAAAFEVQWKIGPLSETSLGNAGGWMYVPDCGFALTCLNNPKFPNPPTNNTGLSDWILSPTVGTGWVLLEDAIDKYVVGKVATNHRILGGKILRTALEPSRSFAGLFMGKLPWQWPAPESAIVKSTKKPVNTSSDEADWTANRRSVGFHYTNVSLPGVRSNCVGCRDSNSGIGVTYGYRILPSVFFDSELDYFPVGNSNSGPSFEGLFGAKIGRQGRNWGVFCKVRPGFIYYDKAWPGRDAKEYDSLSRFALDAGGVVEVYPNRRSTLRFDFGTTLVRYLRDYPNPRLSPLGSLQSPDYYVNQGNLQISSGYVFRF